MGLIDKLFGKEARSAEPTKPLPEHAVLVHFDYGSTDLSRPFALEHELEGHFAAAGAGELDGHEMAVEGVREAEVVLTK